MEFSFQDIALVPVIVILVSIIKSFGVPNRWLPIASIIFGELFAFIYVSPSDFMYAILAGLVMGFTATGAWSGVKNTIEKREPPD